MRARLGPWWLLVGCSAGPNLGPLEPIVPGPGLPPEVHVDRANNNLDVVEHQGRVYLAFRTAPSHFASSAAEMVVLSSSDERQWRHETTFALGTDAREPRFVACGDRLTLYFAQLGSNPTRFEPGRTLQSERGVGGTWSSTRTADLPEGFIPWRVVEHAGRSLLVGYTGGENIYDADGGVLEVHLYESEACGPWRPLDPRGPAVLRGGASETAIAFDRDGRLFAVARNEAGDAGGFGSKICTAPAGALADWSCVDDPRKFDSPLLFEQGGEIYLVARRHLSDTGHYDLGLDYLPTLDAKRLAYLADYSLHPKRCTIWRVDRASLEVSEIEDLPSKGDTCFPSVFFEGPTVARLYNSPSERSEGGELPPETAVSAVPKNHTSPLDDDDDPTWIEGQLGRTSIYATTLEFSE